MKEVKIGTIAKVFNGYAFNSTDYVKEGYRVIRITNVQKGFITNSSRKFIDLKNKLLERFILKQGDILISLTGNVGRVGKVTNEILPAVLNQRVGKIVITSKDVVPDYLFHILNSNIFETRLIEKSKGIAQKNIGSSDIESLLIPLPSLEKQKHIVNVLDQANSLREKRKEAIALLDEYLKSIFLNLFGDPVNNPKAWPSGKVQDLVSDVRYGTSAVASSEGEYPYLRMNNITYSGELDISKLKFINLSDGEKEKYLAKKGDLLFNRTNSKELVGKTTVYNLDKPMAIAGYLIRARTNELAVPEYISGYLNSKHGKKTLEAMCKSIVGMANINAKELQSIKILIPPIDLQKKYAMTVEKAEALKRKMLTQLKEIDSQFHAAVQKSFRYNA